MKKGTRLKIGPVALLVLLAVLTLLVVKRKQLTAEEAVGEAVGVAFKLEDTVVRDKYAAVAFLGLMVLFLFVMWTALRANDREGKAMPPRREPSASDKTAPR